MMSRFRCFMFLLLNAVAGLLSVSGAAFSLKYFCPGNSVQAFQDIKFDRCNAVVSLNVNGERNMRIATWSMHNCTLNTSILPDYSERVFLDQTGTISIRNINHFDQGKYIVISQTDTLPMIYEVEIYVMVPPTKNCKPKIARFGDILMASVKPNDCGNPVATPHWKDNTDVSSTNKEKLKLTPGKEAGTYYACIEGPALACVRNIMPQDYCKSITIEGSNRSIVASESSRMTVYIMIAVLVVILFISATIVIAILVQKSRRNNPKDNQEEASNEHQIFMDSENMTECLELCPIVPPAIFNDNKMRADDKSCKNVIIPLDPPQYMV